MLIFEFFLLIDFLVFYDVKMFETLFISNVYKVIFGNSGTRISGILEKKLLLGGLCSYIGFPFCRVNTDFVTRKKTTKDSYIKTHALILHI